MQTSCPPASCICMCEIYTMFPFKQYCNMIVWYLTGVSAALLPRRLSNFRGIWWFELPISGLHESLRWYGMAFQYADSEEVSERNHYGEMLLYDTPGKNGSSVSLWAWHILRLIHDDVIKWKHYWPFVQGIHRSPANSPHKGQWPRALIFSLTCAWIKGWVNNREAGDLRRHRAHYDVTLMTYGFVTLCCLIDLIECIHSQRKIIRASVYLYVTITSNSLIWT